MTREQASDAILKELNRIGLTNASLRHRVTRALNAFHHDRGDVNIDFAMQGGRVIKVCMYVPDGLMAEVQSELVSVGRKYKPCVIEFGNQGNDKLRNSEGVLYKLNTHVAWTNLTSADISNIGSMVKAFVGDVSQVLNK